MKADLAPAAPLGPVSTAREAHPDSLAQMGSIPIPLSEVHVPVENLAPGSHRKHSRHSKKSSFDSGRSAKTSKTATSGLTSFLKQQAEEASGVAHNVKLHVNHPKQVTSPRSKSWYQHVLAWVGRIGWCGKAVVYAMIGGLACRSAATGRTSNPNLSVENQVTASPQGAFVLLGTTPGGPGANIAVLLIMMLALVAYIIWRFWEGLAGQGYDRNFSAKKNFFKFRVSPIVSGAVYCSYLVFILELLNRKVKNLPDEGGSETWPATWRHTGLGRAGLALLGISFIIATCIQLQGVLTRQWHKDYRSDLPPKVMKVVFTIGHFGFAGRAGAFLAMAVLFFKDASGVNDNPHQYSMVANALIQLQENRGLRAILMIIGILLIIYGLFATLSAWARIFPTPSPSRERPVPAAVIQECEGKSKSPPEAELCEVKGEEDEQLPRDVYAQEHGQGCADGQCATKQLAGRHTEQAAAPGGAVVHDGGPLQPRVLYTTPLVDAPVRNTPEIGRGFAENHSGSPAGTGSVTININ